MIAGKDYNGLKVDIWSCGVILYAMLCGYLPFEDPNTDKLYKKILNCEYSFPSYIKYEAKDLIQKILNTNPEQRYTLQQIREHPWFVDNLKKYKDRNASKPQSSQYDSNYNKKEIKINPNIIVDMVENYKIPANNK